MIVTNYLQLEIGLCHSMTFSKKSMWIVYVTQVFSPLAFFFTTNRLDAKDSSYQVTQEIYLQLGYLLKNILQYLHNIFCNTCIIFFYNTFNSFFLYNTFNIFCNTCIVFSAIPSIHFATLLSEHFLSLSLWCMNR